MTVSTAIPQPLATPFASIEEAIAEVRAGRMVVVVDDADRENEGDLTCAAEKITPAIVNFMAREARGLICAAMTAERLEALRIPLMTADNTSNFGTAFCESIDAREGVTTGISAADRSRSIHALVDDATQPADLARPGHVFPLRARPGGVLTRAGQTEAAVDLARLAGLRPAGVICEIMNEDGSMARVPQLDLFCRQHQLKMITVADLIRYRLLHERNVRRVAESQQQTQHGPCRVLAYRSELDDHMHTALVFGTVSADAPVLVRVQPHCLLATLGATSCGCAANLESALGQIAAAGAGILVYLHQNGPGYEIDASGGLRHVEMPREASHDGSMGGASPTSGAQRDVQRLLGAGSQILADLGVHQLRVLTNHPRRLAGLEGYGLTVTEHVPLR